MTLRMLICAVALALTAVAFAWPVAAFDHKALKVSIDPGDSFALVWQAIIEEMGHEIEIVRLDPEIRRQEFVSGRVAMDCCFISEWRQRPEEIPIQLFSDPLTIQTNNLIHRPGLEFGAFDPEDLGKWRVVTVNGFTYTWGDYFRETVSATSIDHAFELIHEGKGDLTLIGLREFHRVKRARDLEIEIGPVTQELLMRARLHIHHQDLLPSLNAAIAKLKREGKIEELIARSIRGGQNTPR